MSLLPILPNFTVINIQGFEGEKKEYCSSNLKSWVQDLDPSSSSKHKSAEDPHRQWYSVYLHVT